MTTGVKKNTKTKSKSKKDENDESMEDDDESIKKRGRRVTIIQNASSYLKQSKLGRGKTMYSTTFKTFRRGFGAVYFLVDKAKKKQSFLLNDHNSLITFLDHSNCGTIEHGVNTWTWQQYGLVSYGLSDFVHLLLLWIDHNWFVVFLL